jgi:hypothetical protein
MKSIPVRDLFYRVTLDIVGPLPKTSINNKYVLVVVDHYFKWCEMHLIKDHDAIIMARFLYKKIICRFGVPEYIIVLTMVVNG